MKDKKDENNIQEDYFKYSHDSTTGHGEFEKDECFEIMRKFTRKE